MLRQSPVPYGVDLPFYEPADRLRLQPVHCRHRADLGTRYASVPPARHCEWVSVRSRRNTI